MAAGKSDTHGAARSLTVTNHRDPFWSTASQWYPAEPDGQVGQVLHHECPLASQPGGDIAVAYT
jgi:hypothetical protein